MKRTNRYQHLTLLTAVSIAIILSIFIGSCAKKSKDTAIGSSAAPVVNTSLVLVSPGDKTISEGQVLTFTLSATDPNNDPITYTMISTPTITGATLISTTGLFSWMPNYQTGSNDLFLIE
jgi:Kef-type K+ transport system membrane component KefB